MIGLEVEGRPLLRAYSMASANHEEELEFFSIKVADGPLTSKLQKIKQGDTILVRAQGDGYADHRQSDPGQAPAAALDRHGAGAFASLIKDPDVYERYGPSCWFTAAGRSRSSPMAKSWSRNCATMNCSGAAVGEAAVLSTVTREPFRNRGRITDLITSDRCSTIFTSRRSISKPIAYDVRQPGHAGRTAPAVRDARLLEGSHSEPGHFVIEKAFVER